MYVAVKAKGAVVEIGLPTIRDRYYTLAAEVANETFAALLARDLNDRLERAIREAREQAYAQGWKDAKARTRRRDYFSGWLDVK